MNNDKKILYIFSLSLLFILSILLFYPFRYLNVILAVILSIGSIITFLHIKKRKIVSINTRSVILIVSTSAITFLVGYYLLGIKFGFNQTSYPLSISSFATFILPITGIIVFYEYIRYSLMSYESKLVNVILFISGVLLEVLIVRTIPTIKSFNSFIDLIALTFVPAVISNILFNYLSKRYGYFPNTIYKLITTLYIYIIPFVPNVPESLFSLIKLFIPLIILFIVDILYEKKKKIAIKKKQGWAYALYGTVFAFIFSTTLVFSNQFQIGAVVIATTSMTGELNKGDIVFFEQYKTQEIKENEIILFKAEGVLVVHRVVEIADINGEVRYYTKGDFNENRDSGYRVKSDIVGKTLIKCPYVGYVTLWMRDIFKK